MGGVLAHTLVSDSGDGLWDAFANRPFKSLTLPPELKKAALGYFFFRHNPSIDRVAFSQCHITEADLPPELSGALRTGSSGTPKVPLKP
jgi:hypothetical protein